jgi:glutaredoxin
MSIKFFSTGCPKCKVLKKKLDDKNISYQLETNVSTMLSLGITQVPILQVENKFLDFTEAVNFVNTF